MTTLIRYPSSNVADGTAWTNPNNAHADDGAYATAAPAKNGTVASRWSGFGFGDIPAGAIINSVTIETQWKVSTTSSIATLGFQAYVNGAAVGSEYTDAAEPTSDTVRSRVESAGYTRDNLLDANFAVRVRASRANSNVAFTASLDYVKVTVDYTEYVPPIDLTAVDITTGSPTEGTPTIGQTHNLGTSGLATSGPALSAPSIGQVHALAAAGIMAGTPVLGTPDLSQQAQSIQLEATGITTGAVEPGTPALGQIHALQASLLNLGAFSLGNPAIKQIHGLAAETILAGAVEFGEAILAQIHALDTTGISTLAPVLGIPTLESQDEGSVGLFADDLIVGMPEFGHPTISQIHSLEAIPLEAGSFDLGHPGLNLPIGRPGKGLHVGLSKGIEERMMVASWSSD